MKKLLVIAIIVIFTTPTYLSGYAFGMVQKQINDSLWAPAPDSVRMDTLKEVEVVSTGYQILPRERATGSFDFIGQQLIERNTSADLLSRLENLSPGMLFNKGDASRSDPFLIRGRSTLTADAQPLIVVDNFPYDGDISNIDPNIIASVSILKDAAAASIWGARAGNGVVVITTKRGMRREPVIEINSNFTVQPKPDLDNVSWISPADRVDWELYLFEQGYYDAAKLGSSLTSRSNPIPQSIELMLANPSDLQSRLDALRTQDVKSDLSTYFLRKSFSHQHAISFLGASDRYNYAFSAGYSDVRESLVGNAGNRLTLRSANGYQVNDRLKLDAVISLVMNNTDSGNNHGLSMLGYGRYGLSPYTRLVDAAGNGLPYYGDYRKAFLDTVGNGQYLDWLYMPLDDIDLTRNSSKTRDYLIASGVTYNVLDGLTASVNYQFQQQSSESENHRSAGSYYARNQVNRFIQTDPLTGSLSYPVPIGGMLLGNYETLHGHQGRAQLAYEKDWNDGNLINAIVGYEIRSKVTDVNYFNYYGYDETISVVNNLIDFEQYYPLTTSTGSARITNTQGVSKYTDHFLSFYANAAYTHQRKYTLSASFRRDEANLFGVAFNRKGTPLWSVGGAWLVTNESFFDVPFIDFLKLRATYGINGNVSRLASAYTVASFSANGVSHSLRNAAIVSPPNENLRWEQVKMLNVGVDFSLTNQSLRGSVEFYRKHAVDLLAQVPVDPTLAFTVVYANVASMQNTGLDVQLDYRVLSGSVNWNTNLIYSYSTNKVTKYLMPEANRGYTYAGSIYGINPIVGKPLYSAYAYEWAGLDAETGDPLGYLDGEVSKDYLAIYDQPLDRMAYIGPGQPVHFGALRNDFSYKGITLSVGISFKLGHIFRTESLENGLLISQWYGHGDYAKRWQQPGDENRTFVPSLVYPANTQRDRVYKLSSVHYHRADMVRLEDIRLAYTIEGNGQLFKQASLFAYANNLMVLWKAHKTIDPYYNNVPREAGRFTVGLTFKI